MSNIGAGFTAFDSILGTIGGTPAVRLNRVTSSRPDVTVYAKLEGFNPTGSVKDRPALWMIEEAEKAGILKPGDTIIEATSGNTGIGLAMVARVKGYRVLLTMSEGVSIERRKFLAAFGSEIILTPAKEGTDGAIRKCRELVAENPGKYFNPDQFSNPANPLAHYNTTAEEIWGQSDGKITHFVASLGTSGTLGGAGKRLKELNPDIVVIEVQPVLGHKVQGLKNLGEAIVPSLYETTAQCIDQHVVVETDEAYELARKIVKEEGIFVGMSAGAALAGVLRVLPDVPAGSIVYVVFPDRGEKYLSTPLFPYQDPPAPSVVPEGTPPAASDAAPSDAKVETDAKTSKCCALL
jgi:cysteine synthase